MTDGGPVVVGANWYRFRPGEHIHHNHVMSISFVWILQGSGVISTGGDAFHLTSQSILRLPWRHDVDYQADARSPFQVGTIHVVPWHDSSVPVTARVAFAPGDPLLDAAFRRGPALSQKAALMSSRNVIALASYAVERFLTAPFSETAFRALGTLILDESAQEQTAKATPMTVELMTDYIIGNLERHLTVAEIADAGGCSVTTAERHFTRYTGLSVLAWARGARMREAALLLRTTGLRAGEVARRVGFSDPLYFSRVFRATHGVPPSRYAAGQLRP